MGKSNHMAVCLLVLGLGQGAFAEGPPDPVPSGDSPSWTSLPRGIVYAAAAVGLVTMIVSGAVVADGLQEDCTKGFQDQATCDPDQEQVQSGLVWMGGGALLTAGAVAGWGVLELVDRAGARASGPQAGSPRGGGGNAPLQVPADP